MEIIHQSRLAGKDPSVHLSLLPQPLALRSQICATAVPDSHKNLGLGPRACKEGTFLAELSHQTHSYTLKTVVK